MPGTVVSSVQPEFTEALERWWNLMEDTHEGEYAVKLKGTSYLPYTDAQVRDGAGTDNESLGQRAYDAYKLRAKYPEFVKEAVKTALGVMHRKPAKITLPPALEKFIAEATVDGESLQMLLEKITFHQMVTGRAGILAEIVDEETRGIDGMYIALYGAKRIRNWDNGTNDGNAKQKLQLVVLEESENERKLDGFSWQRITKYRVLSFGALETESTTGVYRAQVFRQEQNGFREENQIAPVINGRTTDEIPFVFINPTDIVPKPGEPPLLALARLALTYYRLSADHRQALFMNGQDTLVREGYQEIDGEDDIVVGAASGGIDLPIGGRAYYIGVEGQGLGEMRQTLEADEQEAAHIGGQLLESTNRERESGDALTTRVASRTTSLPRIAKTSAFGLETLLKKIGRWMRLSQDQIDMISVQPNLDFAIEALKGSTIVEFLTAKGMGAPISFRSLHNYLREKDLTNLSFDEEMELIRSEQALLEFLIPMMAGIQDEPAPATVEDDPEDDNGNE